MARVRDAAQSEQRRPYRGLNQLLTQLKQQLRGFETPWWLTYKAARGLGGHVRKGERGTMVVLWKRLLVEDEKSSEKEPVWWMRPYTVFNLDQVDGVEAPEESEERLEFSPISSAEAIVSEMADRPAIEHSPGGAFYVPASDQVHMPPRDSFIDEPSYYGVLFHELVHATGHPSRLDRELRPRSDQERYSREELIAELGAAMLCGSASIDPGIEQSASYIASWLTALRGDKKLVAQAAGRAQRAADFILGVEFSEEAAEDESAAAVAGVEGRPS